MYLLIIPEDETWTDTYTFNTVTDAFLFYAEEVATIGEKISYFRLTRQRMRDVRDENLMLQIFQECITHAALFADGDLY